MAASDEIFGQYIAELQYREAALIESDLSSLLGWRMFALPPFLLRRLGYEVVWQRPPAERGITVEEYRGIMRAGVMLVDHHPTWPLEATDA